MANTTRPRLLDLFCGAGGAAVGYHRAGFEVVGVDIKPQPNYPFEFVQGDALEWLRLEIVSPDCRAFSAFHASPPCQAHTTLSRRWRGKGTAADEHVDLIAPTRDLLEQTGLPWVIENVAGARWSLRDPVVICGATVGLRQSRHRLFETNWPLLVGKCVCKGREFKNVIGAKPDGRWLRKDQDGNHRNFVVSSIEEGREVLGIDWMDWRELAESVPPAYTEVIGAQLLAHLKATVDA